MPSCGDHFSVSAQLTGCVAHLRSGKLGIEKKVVGSENKEL